MREAVTEKCIQRNCENIDSNSCGLYCMANECVFEETNNEKIGKTENDNSQDLSELIKLITNGTIIEKCIEPTDSEGKEMDAVYEFDGKDYSVYLSWYDNNSYEEQAAKQILEELKKTDANKCIFEETNNKKKGKKWQALIKFR